MDIEFMQRVLPLYERAAYLTVTIGLAGVVLSIAVGMVCVAAQYFKIPVLRQIAAIYIELSRNTPLLVQLFFIYYGLPKVGVILSAEVCGCLGLTFLGGSYMAEAFLSGLTSVSPVQRESGLSLGLSEGQVFFRIIMPQAVSVSIPGIVANIIFLLKETSVFSAVSLMDLMYTAKDLIGMYYKTSESLVLLVLFYMIILIPVSGLGMFVERQVRYAGFGT